MKEETREVEKIVQEQEKVYIAEDGGEFRSATECLNHEWNLQVQKLLATVEHNFTLDNVPPLCVEHYSEHEQFRWYRPHNTEELELVCKTYGVRCDESLVGKWLCIGYCARTRCWIAGTLDEEIDYIRAYMGQFGLDVSTVSKGEDAQNTENQKTLNPLLQCSEETLTKLKEIMDDGNKATAFADEIFHQIESDDEPYYKKGRSIARSLINGDACDLMVSLCGWSANSLVEFTEQRIADNPEEYGNGSSDDEADADIMSDKVYQELLECGFDQDWLDTVRARFEPKSSGKYKMVVYDMERIDQDPEAGRYLITTRFDTERELSIIHFFFEGQGYVLFADDDKEIGRGIIDGAPFEEVEEYSGIEWNWLSPKELGPWYEQYHEKELAAHGVSTSDLNTKEEPVKASEGEQEEYKYLEFGDECKIRVPSKPIDCSGLNYFDELEYSCWKLVKEFLDTLGIKIVSEETEDCFIEKAVEEFILGLLEEAGVRMIFGADDEGKEEQA